MKVTIKGFISASKSRDYDIENKRFVERLEFGFTPYDRSMHDSSIVTIREQEFEIDVPDNLDLRDGLVANLERDKRKLTAEFQARVTSLNAQIQSLLAIENKATEAA
jgi:hypothetical protein